MKINNAEKVTGLIERNALNVLESLGIWVEDGDLEWEFDKATGKLISKGKRSIEDYTDGGRRAEWKVLIG